MCTEVPIRACKEVHIMMCKEVRIRRIRQDRGKAAEGGFFASYLYSSLGFEEIKNSIQKKDRKFQF